MSDRVTASLSIGVMAPPATRSNAVLPATSLALPASGERELRIDLFRGLALWLIFVDHLSPDLLTWFTIRNYGFSDAAEIFIFISGYTAAFVYGRTMYKSGAVLGAARILRRVVQIYATHLLLFLVVIAEVTCVTAISGTPFYIQETGLSQFFQDPGNTVIQTLLLRFRPLNMDVLPLYVVMMCFLPLVLLLAKWRVDLPLAISVALYLLTLRFDLHLSSYPAGFWSFNPFAWQLLFFFGAWCSLGGRPRLAPLLKLNVVFGCAVLYLLAAFFVTLTWYFPSLEQLMPHWLVQWIYPINKTDLDILRFLHFLALAIVGLRFVPVDWHGLTSPWFRPMVLCGQHSLQIFAFGVALAFAGYALLTETSAGLAMHALAAVVGIGIMSALAWLLTWQKHALDGGKRGKLPSAIKMKDETASRYPQMAAAALTTEPQTERQPNT